MPDALTQMLEQLPPSFRDNGSLNQVGKVQLGLGTGFLTMGAIFAIVGATTAEPGMWAGAIGPALAGAINIVGGAFLIRRSRGQESPVELSADARNLATGLYLEKVGHRMHRHGPRSRMMSNARPAVVLPEPVERALNDFAGAYLSLKEAALDRNADTSRHGVRAKLAADEAAAEAFNLAAKAVRQPGQGHEEELQKLIASVHEAANRLDPRASSPGALSSLLTDLREEERARQELNG